MKAEMLRNYLSVMMRNMMRQKFHAAINVIGLTVAISFALLIGMFIRSELLVNKNIADVDRLYLMESEYKKVVENFPVFVPCPLAVTAVEEYPTVFENYYRFWDREVTASADDRHFRVQTMIGDSTFFQMFQFPIASGSSDKTLTQPYSIAITEKIAHQFFDRTDVVGETILITTEQNGMKPFEIQAVLKDVQQKNSVSDFMNSNAQMFIPLLNAPDFSLSDDLQDWTADIIAYLKLKPGATHEQALSHLNELLRKHTPQDVTQNRSILLNALGNYYLLTNRGIVMNLIISLAVIVVFILLLAIVNFINISIAGSFSRLKEIGVRKVIGAVKGQVIFQFLLESYLLTFFALGLSLVAYEFFRGYFGILLSSPLSSVLNFNGIIWMYLLVGIGLIGFIAGSYPSLYLSSTRIQESLKGKAKSVNNHIRFSRALIAFQFLVTIFVFISSMVMSRQISFFMEKDLGFDKSHVINVTSVPRLLTPEGFDKIESVKAEFLSVPEIEAATLSWGAPSNSLTPKDFKIYRAGQPVDEGIQTSFGSADEDYAKVYGLRLVEGKFLFDEDAPRQPNTIVLNETAQRALNAQVGEQVRIQFFGDTDFTVTGIVKDFHYKSFHEPIRPLAFMHNRDFRFYRHYSFKVKAENLAQSVQAVEHVWKKVFPNDPMVYGFVDEKIEALYQTELKLKKAATIGALLMFILVLTGVLGLVSLSLHKRTKEIGIRKVLGASIRSILALISKEYAIIIIVATVISIPLTWFAIRLWLNRFVYHINLSWWMFLIPVVGLFLVTIFMVALQSTKTALSNPVDSLRYE